MPLRIPLQDSGAATTADAAYLALRQGILQGDLAPGERLRSDALANELKVSRTPVREALRKLEAEGLVQRSGSGLIVREFSEQDLTELFYVREALEGMAARLAAENATPGEIADIRELLDDMEAVGQRGDVVALRPLTAEYHRLVGRAAHNGRLLQSLESLLEHVRQMQTSTLLNIEGRAVDALKEHHELLQAIEARDADSAEKLARTHRRKTLELRRQLLRARLRESRSNGGRLREGGLED
ncbi:MAG TPA: GntR family transcriptional regulator [Xanthobacteraceae bacterium]|jgi:DNA-binding GntR family transcriptional regulator|nr:GntR family transcriptional regulator [Xanthobacteraceae bacterium]